jgi:hypothetical protein
MTATEGEPWRRRSGRRARSAEAHGVDRDEQAAGAGVAGEPGRRRSGRRGCRADACWRGGRIPSYPPIYQFLPQQLHECQPRSLLRAETSCRAVSFFEGIEPAHWPPSSSCVMSEIREKEIRLRRGGAEGRAAAVELIVQLALAHAPAHSPSRVRPPFHEWKPASNSLWPLWPQIHCNFRWPQIHRNSQKKHGSLKFLDLAAYFFSMAETCSFFLILLYHFLKFS